MYIAEQLIDAGKLSERKDGISVFDTCPIPFVCCCAALLNGGNLFVLRCDLLLDSLYRNKGFLDGRCLRSGRFFGVCKCLFLRSDVRTSCCNRRLKRALFQYQQIHILLVLALAGVGE
ncbi:hypothetical protein D1872_239110 [compost metagenome]